MGIDNKRKELYEYIERYGLSDYRTMIINKELDILVLEAQIKMMN